VRRFVPALGLVLLAGCAMGPNYKRPRIETPGEFRGGPATGADASVSIADTKWQNLFADPVLTQMVTNALQHNFDMRIAAARVEEARAQLGITRASQYPNLGAQAGLTASRPSSVASTTFVAPGTDLSATYSTIHMTLPLRTRTATPTRPTVLLHDLPEQSIHRTHRSVATCMAGRRILGYSEATIARRVMRVVRHGVGSPINVCHHLLAGLSRPINLYPLRGASDVSLLVISGRLGEVLEPVMWQGRYLIEIRDAVDKL